MAILSECPGCRKKQSIKNKRCKCGEDLDKAKRSQRIKYWIDYKLPGGKARRESIGYSIQDARAAEGKRRSQKKENRIFEMLPESRMTFEELAAWYLDLSKVKRLASYETVAILVENFNKVFGHRMVSSIKPMELEEYQERRLQEGKAPATVDMEIGRVKSMVKKAWENDMLSDQPVKVFNRMERRFKTYSNARDRVLTVSEYLSLKKVALPHAKSILITAFNTGMRQGELLKLKWSYVDRENQMIRFPLGLTKEGKIRGISEDSHLKKNIPINHRVKEVLDKTPRALHHDYVFTYQGKPIKLKIRKAFEAACKDAGILYGQKVENGVRFHDIRTTFKTYMLRAGVDKALRDTILGHSLRGMDAYYLKPSDEDLTEAIQKYTKWFDAQVENLDQSLDQGKNQLGAKPK